MSTKYLVKVSYDDQNPQNSCIMNSIITLILHVFERFDVSDIQVKL